MVCACFLGGGDGGKHEAMIIKNINWLQKKNYVFLPFLHSTPLCAVAPLISMGGGGIWIKTT